MGGSGWVWVGGGWGVGKCINFRQFLRNFHEIFGIPGNFCEFPENGPD